MTAELYPVGEYWIMPLQKIVWVIDTFGPCNNQWRVVNKQLCFDSESNYALFLLRWQ